MGSRLSENKAFRVLIIEAGRSTNGIEAVNVPLMMTQNSPGLSYNWFIPSMIPLRLAFSSSISQELYVGTQA